MAQISSNSENTEHKPLKEFTEKAYLDYAMYVILDRALPHIGDGLKPVQRRIIYAMSELGLKAAAKHKKSVRTVGDVIGKFHPHGDSACYEAMVLMAQDFSYRYPLIDGQGNWGSSDDPKSFAAMRYTEARLSTYAEVLLSELEQDTVEWVANFDGTLMEPALLPARLPNLLLNGASGIAVGMATDIPPHNLREVANACIEILRNPKASLNDLLKHVQGPDFPTEAEIITPTEDIKQIYQQGYGSIRMRAVYTLEELNIIITALPHQVSGAKILEQIANQMQAKKLPMVTDLRDESDHENPVRLVIELRSNRVDIEPLMAHLFASTDLERSYRINLNIIGLDGRPQVKDLLTLLKEWVDYRHITVKRRLQYRLDKVLARLHILEGLLIAFLNLDEVIAIIRYEDDAKTILMQRFSLSSAQAEAILELKLRHLAKLEEHKIKAEQQELTVERNKLQAILNSPSQLTNLIINEIKLDTERYGDHRRSPIVARPQAQLLREEDVLPAEPITVILSNKGWIRAAKGHEIDGSKINYKAGDEFKMQALGRSSQFAIFLDSSGRSYSLPAHTLPSARGQGEPLTGWVTPPVDVEFIAVLMGEPEQKYLLASDAGYGFIINLSDLLAKNRNGKAILTLPSMSKILTPQLIHDVEQQYLAAVSTEGRLLVIPLKELPQLSKGKGNKIMNISATKAANREELLSVIVVFSPQQSLTLFSGKRKLTLSAADIKGYQGERGQRGNKLPKGFLKIDQVTVKD